MCQLLQE